MKPSAVVIHFPQTNSVKQHLNDLELEYKTNDGEYDVIVDDTPGDIVEEGYYQDPDVEICDHYGINYDLINCVEALY